MTGSELLSAYATLKRTCAIKQIKSKGGKKYYEPVIILDVVSSLKPAVVIYDGITLRIIGAEDISDTLNADTDYVLATEAVLRELTDTIGY